MFAEGELKVCLVSLSFVCALCCHLCLRVSSRSEEARLSKSCKQVLPGIWFSWFLPDRF